MKITVKELKELIREDYMRGIPEFAIRSVADECIENMRRHIVKGINLRAQNPAQQREMIQSANKVLEDLREELYEKLEDKLFQFMQSV